MRKRALFVFDWQQMTNQHFQFVEDHAVHYDELIFLLDRPDEWISPLSPVRQLSCGGMLELLNAVLAQRLNKPFYLLPVAGKGQPDLYHWFHCNLKCRDCCNISPFNAKKFISTEEVQEICEFVKLQFRPDVFKIAGGEPTLHPQLDEILKIVKGSGAASVVRVISNGLLLHRMSEVFWQNIDQLTISNYVSAPVKPRLLEEIRQKARLYEVVLNIKYVDQFNEIFVDDAIEDQERIKEIYDDCWMRHRCLIIRNGRFYKCTRAAYMDEFLQIKGKPAAVGHSSYSAEDGLTLNDPDFRSKALAYLNTDKPLHSCEYCLGVSGGLRENIQLRTVK